MSSALLRHRRVLVAEDEYMLMDELCKKLESAGAIVVGPAGTLGDTMALLRSAMPLDGAILDVNLRGEKVFAAADILIALNIPFVFVTGYDEEAMPSRFANVMRCEKPVDMSGVASAIGAAIAARV